MRRQVKVSIKGNVAMESKGRGKGADVGRGEGRAVWPIGLG